MDEPNEMRQRYSGPRAGRPPSVTAGRAVARGFSLVELVVALAVAAILMGVAAPSFGELAMDLRQSGLHNALAGDLRLARLEAIKRGGQVSVCARGGATSCGDDWSGGWHVFAESVGGTTGDIDAGERLIRSRSGVGKGLRLAARAVLRPQPLAARPHIVFDGRGRADWTLGTIVFCDGRGATGARALVVNGAGGVRRAQPASDADESVADAFGDPVECPS